MKFRLLQELLLKMSTLTLQALIINTVFIGAIYASGEANQQILITGRVTSAEDETGLPGVNVIIKGTTQGTVTDVNGEYKIHVPSTETVLVFSFVGYVSEEITVSNQTVIDITMTPDITALEEIVVIGYGTQKKSDLTGSVTRVAIEKQKNLPNTNVLQYLQGTVPGVYVGQQLRPGQQPSLRIRGINSLSASNSPLIVIDNIIYDGSLNNIDVNDIESVDILKDASAAAVYGSRSANGVVIITTKKGKSDKPEFNLNSYFGVSNPVRMLDPLTGEKYIQRILDHRLASGLGVETSEIVSYLRANELDNYNSGQEVNWIDDLLQTGTIQNHHLDVSGRTDKTNYYISGTFFTQKGIVENDNFNKYALRANFSNNITDWLTIGLKTNFATLNYDGAAANVGSAYYMSPYGKYWADEAQTQYEWFPHNEVTTRHPKIDFLIDDVDRRNNFFGVGNLILNIPFISGLQFNMDFSGNLTNTKRNYFIPFNHPSGYNANGIASKFFSDSFDWTWDNTLNYKRIFAQDHSLNFTFLYSRIYRKIENTTANGRNFFTDALGFNNLSMAENQTIASNYGDENNIAYMGRINYGFKDRYLLTATYRRDGFSGFGKGNKWADFPSIGLGWIISEEDLMKDMVWLDFLKFRFSYGKNGNQALGRYKTLASMGTSKYVYGSATVTSSYLSTMANQELGWETTEGYNFGLDFGILKNRLDGSVNSYSTDTYNLILQRSLPTTSGYNSTYQNLGKVHNSGIELSLNAAILQKEKLNWDVGFVFSRLRNRIDKLYGTDADEDGKEDDDIANGWFIGESLGSLYSYELDGIYQEGDKILPGFKPGYFRLVDQNGDGEITPEDDRLIVGNSLPNFTWGLTNTFRFKNFSLYIFINGIQGGGKDDYYVGNNWLGHVIEQNKGYGQRFGAVDIPYWTSENPTNKYAIVNYIAPRPHLILEARSFMRVQDVRLTYDLPNYLMQNWHIGGLSFYASAKNLLTTGTFLLAASEVYKLKK